MANWEAIQADYEHGMSLRLLASKYAVPKTTIHEHALAGQWTRTADGQQGGQRTPPKFTDVPPTTEIGSLASKMVGELAKIANAPLELKEHKLFADALSQYGKILLADGPAADQADPLQGKAVLVEPDLMQYITNEELDQIEKIVSLASERKVQADQDREVLERKRA